MNPEHLLDEGPPPVALAAPRLTALRDSRGFPVRRWPTRVLPSTTVIVTERRVVRETPARAWHVLVQQRADNGWWAFPGGRQEIGESIQECARRECLEETGYAIALDVLTSVDSDPCAGAIVEYPTEAIQYTCMTFLAHSIGGNLQVSPESRQVCWCSTANLPRPFLPSHLWRLHSAQRHGGAVAIR